VTLLDQSGVTPRVVQMIMRHSNLELKGRYTKPRVVDIENAASMLPSLKQETSDAIVIATGTTNSKPVKTEIGVPTANAYGSKSKADSSLESRVQRSAHQS
jgi:hypothetical protein